MQKNVLGRIYEAQQFRKKVLILSGTRPRRAAAGKLVELDVSRNQLTSVMEIGGLTSLTSLDVSNNGLTSLPLDRSKFSHGFEKAVRRREPPHVATDTRKIYKSKCSRHLGNPLPN